LAGALLGFLLAAPIAGAQAQNATISGKVLSDFGQPLEGANVFITELGYSVGTNAQGLYTINIPSARTDGRQVVVRVRALGYMPQVRMIRVTAGAQTVDFSLKQDVNRLAEVVVTGTVEGTERAKVPYAISRLSLEELPVPALNPLTSLQGKAPGVRVAASSGRPGSTPDIMLRGPTSINASGRSQGPLIIVDGAILNVGSFDELGGLDIESIEVVKGAAGASLYGTKAANGVITIKTKRGASQDGVKFNLRSEYGFSDLNSLSYGMPINHPLQLDETGTRFCVQGSSNVASCSRTVDWMSEIMRVNSPKADTTNTPLNLEWGVPGVGDGSLLNVFQSQVWPGQYYNTFAQIATRNPQTLNVLDATGRVGGVRFYVSGSYTDEAGAIKLASGQQQRRARVNLDYDVKSNLLVSLSTMYDRGTTDLHNVAFGSLLRGAPPGTNFLARDSLDRLLLLGAGAARPTGNGAGAFLYNLENEQLFRKSQRFLGSMTTTYFPADWVTVEGVFSYDNRNRVDNDFVVKGYRTTQSSSSTNFGNGSLGDRQDEAMNGSLTATLRKQVSNDLNGKISFRGLFDQQTIAQNSASGQQLIVKDVYTLSNTRTNQTATSSSQTDKNMGVLAGVSGEYKGRYIMDGTFRYDGSSRFGAGNRWAPFGRVSAVWRVSEEPFWNVPKVSDFRLRASRGSAGNPPRFTAQYETYDCSTSGCQLGQAGNSKLKPETTTETEVGTDFTLFDRLGVEITNANSSTRDQILNVPTPASLGFGNQWQNAGTLANHTWELALNLPVITRRDMQWSMRGTWDRTRTYITKLFMPEYFTSAGTGQGTGSFFLITDRKGTQDGERINRLGNVWGRKFYRKCSDLPESVQAQCGDGKAYQVNDKGWVVWVGDGNSWADGITKNLWQTKLPAAQSPWNYPLYFGHPIVDRPLRGEPGEGIGKLHILGNTLPDFRLTFTNNVTYKRLTLYALVDGTFGHDINNQGEGWGLLDMNSHYFDQADNNIETAKPIGYSWRVGGSEGAGTGGFYDILGPNNYNVENGSYAKIREVSLSYRVGRVRGVGGDWTVGLVGRNMMTFTKYSGYDPEVGVSGSGQADSGLINQVDAFDFPTLRTFTLSLSTRF
jgi:TonB-linked SusC/RagA family outer membrane protein